MTINEIITYSDGGSRGNPGRAAIGFVILGDGKELVCAGEVIGETTNNVAEYKAIVSALQKIKEAGWKPKMITCKLDSELVVNQIKGKYKIKQQHLLEFYWEIKYLCEVFQSQGCQTLSFIHIPREQNQKADLLVNQALDGVIVK